MTAKSTDQLIRDKAQEMIDDHELYPANLHQAVELLTQEISERLVQLATCNLNREVIRYIINNHDDE